MYQSYVSSFNFGSCGPCLRQRLVLGQSQTHFSCWQIVSLHSVCKCAHHSQTAWMWFGTSVWSPPQKKADGGETEGEEWERGGVVRPQGCSERSPQFFHHCCRHHHGVVLLLSGARGQREADAKRVHGDGREKKKGWEKARLGQSNCVRSCQSGWWLMRLKVRSGNS